MPTRVHIIALLKRIAILPFVVSILQAQDFHGDISGKVTDIDGVPLPGANVVVVGTTLGDVADERGAFLIRRVPPGRYDVVASMIGFRAETASNVLISPRQTAEVRFSLQETVIELGEVNITARVQKQEQSDPRTSLRFMEPVNSKILPGFGEDVLRSLAVLPGVAATSDFTSQLAVRGGGPDQNLIVMDDIEIFNPYRLYGFVSMFNPETVSGISLITGGYPAKYGDRLSSVLDVSNKEGTRKESIRGSVNASITNMNVVMEGRLPGIEGSYLVSGRRTYYDLIVGPIAKEAKLVEGDVALPNFGDLQAKIVIGPFGAHRFIVNGMRSRDGVDIVTGSDRPTPDSVNVFDETNHSVLGFAYHYIPSDEFFLKAVASYYRNDGTSEFAGAILDPSLDRDLYQDSSAQAVTIRFFEVSGRSKYVFEKTSLKQEVTIRRSAHILEAGAGIDFITTSLNFDFTLDPQLRAIIAQSGNSAIPSLTAKKVYNRLNAFVQDKIKLSPSLFIQPGLRFDYYGILKESHLSPRLNSSFIVNPVTTLRAAYGRFYQSPGYEKVVDSRSGFTEFQDEYLKDLNASSADHYVLGMDRWISGQWRMTIDLYYKKLNDLITPKIVNGTKYVAETYPNTNPRFITSWKEPYLVRADSVTNIPVNNSFGEAYGIELLLEKASIGPEDRISGWVSYALAWANRYENGVTVPFDFDQRHTLNIVGNWKANSWLDIGAVWRIGSNFPYTKPVGVRPRIAVVEINGNEVPTVQYDPFTGMVIFDVDRGDNNNNARRPMYHRLDLRFTAKTRFWGLDWGFYLDIINVYNHKNVINYRYRIQDDLSLVAEEVSMFPILPTLGMSVKF